MSKKIIIFLFFSFFIVMGFPLISFAQDGDVVCDIPYSDLTLDTDIEGEYTCQFIGYSDHCTDSIKKNQVIYMSVSSDNEIVVYLHSDKRYHHYDCFGYLTLSNDNVVHSLKYTYWQDNIQAYFTGYINDHKIVNDSDFISDYISVKGVCHIVNDNTDSSNRKNIILQSNAKVFDTYENALQYLIDGSTNGMIDDGKPYDIDDISFSSFKVTPHKSASFDNFYFDVRYELSPYVQNNLENATITLTQKYEGSLLVEKLEHGGVDDFAVSGSGFCNSYSYGPYSKSITIPLKYAKAGFTPYLKDMVIFDDYLKDAFPKGYLFFDYRKKMQLLGYSGWQSLDSLIYDDVFKYKPESSRLYLIGNITVNGESGKPFTFCYDFLEGQGETEYIPWEEDEPNPEPIVDTVVPDDEPIVDTSTDGNGVNINIDIDNNNNGGSGEYVDVNPDDYRSFIGMYKDTMGEFKTEGNTFEFLKGALSH